MRFKVGIPARYAATRFPGKPLADIGGKPMIQRVFEAAMQAGAEQVIVATDDDRIAHAAKAFGAVVCMTADTHSSGTERLGEAAARLGWSDADIVVNLQGDEPLMAPENIRQVAANLQARSDIQVTTLCALIEDPADLGNSNIVKVVRDARGRALYFSRSCIPWPEGAGLPAGLWHRHIGLYAYRGAYLRDFASLDVSPLERVERLEQLRVLWHGGRIHVDVACRPTVAGVDTPDDIERVRALVARAH